VGAATKSVAAHVIFGAGVAVVAGSAVDGMGARACGAVVVSAHVTVVETLTLIIGRVYALAILALVEGARLAVVRAYTVGVGGAHAGPGLADRRQGAGIRVVKAVVVALAGCPERPQPRVGH